LDCPSHEDVLAVAMRCGIAAIEAALFDRLAVSDGDLDVVKRIEAERADLGTGIDQRTPCHARPS